MASPPRKLLVVFEFAPSDEEWMLRDLVQALNHLRPELGISFCTGWVRRYAPGGLQPARLLNGLWVHLRAFFDVLLGCQDVVLVRSAPPLIQITVAFACGLRGLPYWVWIMDAHPELEQELWSRFRGLGFLLRALVRINRYCLQRSELVVVLDPGMRDRLVPNLVEARVIVCPTWGRSRIATVATLPAQA